MAPKLTVIHQTGGSGTCHLCGKDSLDRAAVSLTGRLATIWVCEDCAQSVVDDQPTFSRVVNILNHE
jgi:ribosomal protein L37AE/L43A